MNTTTRHIAPTVAAFKRAMRPGATVAIVNHALPRMNRVAVVLEATNTRDLVVTRPVPEETDPQGSHIPWPKAGDYRPDPDRANVVHLNGLTLTILEH